MRLRDSLQKEADREKIENGNQIRDITVINANLKLIKLYCNDIPFDISFNQIGGIVSLGFLEMISEKFGKDQIFKKSIILIKAWALYETRILASNLGCMASYTLQTLIIYVLNEFYEEMKSPLDVMFKFFEIFGQFDWDMYILTIFGPIERSGIFE